ncbi:MAG: redoxin domain-containing protein [Parachlamydiales bacterium]|nr:redoxin domain-containing protein [Parachlamydiales bacterium]
MTLKKGDRAPDFELTTKAKDGPKKLKLSDNYGKKNTVLLFFPMAFTGGCTQEMCDVSKGLHNLDQDNSIVWGISGDNPFSQEAWAQKEHITVSLLSDYDHAVTKDYGVAYESFLPDHNLGMKDVPKRAAFVVGKDGTIQYAESNDDPHLMPDFKKIVEVLKSLQ